MKKFKKTGITKIPPGIAQNDDFDIHNTDFEVVGMRYDLTTWFIDVLYSYKQGPVNRRLQLTYEVTPTAGQQTTIDALIAEAETHILSLTHHSGAIEV